MRPNKLEYFSLETLSSQVLEFEGKARANWSAFRMLPSWVSSWCYQQMLDETEKFLPGANTPAYLALSLAMKKKGFITLTPGVNVIKLFFFVTDDKAK